MAVLKCKMCGGDIVVNEEKTFGTCDYCGSTMTLPKVSDDQRAARFNRGNHFRRQGDFDKALAVYETIVNEDDADAEAHWCCALCRFGIEYVEDPNTYEYLPTCHRASFDSFLEDPDYLAALEYSDGITRRQYQRDAAKIAAVQRGILATSQNEEPYDVFICYKETDDQTKERTRDSLDAQEIYYQLTQEGYRVFFSRITLEDKVGTEYEPYIFAALNSAKVMIAIGSKPEYFNAVWVKNEWSRFLAMMRNDRSKLLLPCYKDMDPYDLPEQLGVLQSYDMTKIGFIQDLIRGVKKVLRKDEPKAQQVVAVNSGASDIAPLLKRMFMYLEDGEWDKANEYSERVLDKDPENAEAYLGKLMVNLRVSHREDLKNQAQPFDQNKNYQKATRFADESLKASLKNDITTINNRILEGKYVNAKTKMEGAKTFSDYGEAVKLFNELGDYKDSCALAQECDKKEKELETQTKYKAAVTEFKSAVTIEDFLRAAELLDAVGDYEDAAELLKEAKYSAAGMITESAITEEAFSKGIKLFEEIGDYKDAPKMKEERKASWMTRADRAVDIWKEYSSINDKCQEISDEINKITNQNDSLRKEIAKLQSLREQVRSAEKDAVTFAEEYQRIQQLLSQANSEMSSLGVFAFSKKKEVSERISKLSVQSKECSEKLARANAFIAQNDSSETISSTIETKEKSVIDFSNQLKPLNDELSVYYQQTIPLFETLKDRQTIAILAQNEEILPSLIKDNSIAMIIKADKELRDVVTTTRAFYYLPEADRNSITGKKTGKKSIDVEAVYYQACDAMKTARSIDDIKWACGEFSSIRNYKDSNVLLEKCCEMIANNTISD